MIRVKSNIKGFLKAYRKKVENVKSILNGFAEKLAQRMSEDMLDEILTTKATWAPNELQQDETGKMGTIEDVKFEIVSTSNTSVKVVIGENLPKHKMSDGNVVNPVYFIEFGFGIMGKENPQEKAEDFGWIYNKEGHEVAWWYKGFDNKSHYSKGAVGINFLYRTIDKYKKDWKDYLIQLLNEGV